MKKIVLIGLLLVVSCMGLQASVRSTYTVAGINLSGLKYQINESAMNATLEYMNYSENFLEVFTDTIDAGDKTLLDSLVSSHNGEMAPHIPTTGISVSTSGVAYLKSSDGESIVVKSNLIFDEAANVCLGMDGTGRIYKLYVSSEIKVGENCLTFSETGIFSSTLGDYVMTIGTNSISIPKKAYMNSLEVDAGFQSHGRGRIIAEDIEIDGEDRGLILRAPNGTKWLRWADNNGGVFSTQVAASPEISFEERKIRIAAHREKIQEIKDRKNGNLTIQERIQRIEEYLGIE